MNKQDIEKAIKIAEDWVFLRNEPEDAAKTLIRVAEAWLALFDYVDRFDVEDQERPVPFRHLRHKMQELLNPKPQTDIERIREWACQHEVPTPGRFFRYEDRGELKKLLNELEAEKKEQP